MYYLQIPTYLSSSLPSVHKVATRLRHPVLSLGFVSASPRVMPSSLYIALKYTRYTIFLSFSPFFAVHVYCLLQKPMTLRIIKNRT